MYAPKLLSPMEINAKRTYYTYIYKYIIYIYIHPIMNNESLDLWVPRLEVKFRPVRDLEVAGIATMKSGKLGVFGGR
jgi:hypothetical protein